MITPFNQLSPLQLELLALLSEEAAESIQAIGKIMRHGFESCHPDSQRTNREDLEREIGDLHAAIQLLVFYQVLDMERIEYAIQDKLGRLDQYLHHAEVPEALLE